jgi:hypothetical protein
MKLYMVPLLEELLLFIILQQVGMPQYQANMCARFLMTHFLADELAMVDQCPGLMVP